MLVYAASTVGGLCPFNYSSIAVSAEPEQHTLALQCEQFYAEIKTEMYFNFSQKVVTDIA